MLNPRSLSTSEAHLILAHVDPSDEDAWDRLAHRAGLEQGDVDRLHDLCCLLVLGRRPVSRIERRIVKRVLVAIGEKAAA